PRAMVERGASSSNGLVDVSGIGFCDVSDDFAGGRIDGRKSLAGSSVGPFAVDEQFVGGDLNGGFHYGRGSSHEKAYCRNAGGQTKEGYSCGRWEATCRGTIVQMREDGWRDTPIAILCNCGIQRS